MPFETAERIINFAFINTPLSEKIEIAFFGGEPLLEFDLIKKIILSIENHRSYNPERVDVELVTNGTIFSEEIGSFLSKHDITFCLSCDGPPEIQNVSRKYKNGKGSSAAVERTIREARNFFPSILVNAVYSPSTINSLPDIVEYLSALGLRQIYLNPDFSAPWTLADADRLEEIYGRLGEKYINFHRSENAHFISLINSKLSVILKDGYGPLERCRMGKGEFAFGPSGNVYPCERLLGGDDGGGHCIGNIFTGISEGPNCGNVAPAPNVNNECLNCGLKDYCMNWCGCSNFFSSGYYNRVGPFLCASEKAAISTAFSVFRVLSETFGLSFIERLTGVSPMDRCERR